MYKITKEFSFCASHKLNELPLTHPCSKLHGHNYVVKVELESKTLNKIGFVLDYRKLSVIKKWIDDRLDHKHLNDVFEFNPTAENIAKRLYENFSKILNTDVLKAVEISETPKTNARYESDNN